MTDNAPTDDGPIDMAPFLERHDRRMRRAVVAMLAVSLVLSAAIFARGELAAGVVGATLADSWHPSMMGPLFIVALWVAGAMGARKNPLPGADTPVNVDDARNIRRFANAGTVFVIGFNAAIIAGQAAWLLSTLGALPPSTPDSDWNVRASLVVMGVLSMFIGNVSPRVPTPRAPEAKPAVRMRHNRLVAWVIVIFGASLALAGLLLPFQAMLLAAPAICISMFLALGVGTIRYRRALEAT